jgi:hypothetical protein
MHGKRVRIGVSASRSAGTIGSAKNAEKAAVTATRRRARR